jgi:hypothetical protein
VVQTIATWNVAKDYWIDHRWVDLLLTSVLIAVHYSLIFFAAGFDFFAYAAVEERRAMYSASAVVVSLLGAFSGVVIGQASSGKGDRLMALKKNGGDELAANWRGIYLAAIFAAISALFCLLVDVGSPGVAIHVPSLARWVFEGALLLCALKFIRLTAIFEPIIASSARDDAEKDASPPDAPVMHPKWDQNRTAS